MSDDRAAHREKLSTIRSLADAVTHQLNNRLNQFSMVSGKLKRDIEAFVRDNPESAAPDTPAGRAISSWRRMAETMLSNVARTDEFAKSLAAFARYDGPRRQERFSASEAVSAALGLLAEKHNGELPAHRMDINPAASITGFRAQITEAVYCVLETISEHLRASAAAQAALSAAPLPITIHFESAPGTSSLVITHNTADPQDNGSNASTIASSFGMHIAKHIVSDLHHGRILAVTAADGSAHITIEIPDPS